MASQNDRLAQLSYEPFTDPQIAFQPTLAAPSETATHAAQFPLAAQLLDDGDADEPPASLLVEIGPPSPRINPKRAAFSSPPPPEYTAPSVYPDGPRWESFGPSEATAERSQVPRWLTRAWSTPRPHLGRFRRPTASRPSLKERVLRQWRDYAGQDEFFARVYAYYVGKGITALFLSRLLNWLVLGFVVGFSVFLGGCVDYSQIHTAPSLAAVVVPHCWRQFSLPVQALMTIAAACYGLQLVHLVYELGQLRELHCFYTQALGISHQELQTCSWNQVVRQLVELRDQDLLAMKRRAEQTLGSKASRTAHARRLKALRLNTHDIANRIMRRDNYLIALFNRDVLNLAVPFTTWLPFGGERPSPGTPAVSTLLYPDLTKVLEWNLLFCLTGPVFDRQGHVHRKVLRESYRAELTMVLRRRFLFMGWVNLVCFPFIAVFLLLHFFYRYFDEIYRNPGSAASRQYTAYARWKFRDFNELPHLFHTRLNQSYPKAVEYLAQFPQEVVHLLARFASFIAGSFAAVLFLLTMWDYELSLEFEVTPGKTVLFYISVFGAIATASRAMLPAAFQPRDPAQALQQVLDHLHYLPTDWRGQLHTPQVRAQFEQLFDYKLRIYARELCSVVTTPFVLWFSLAPGADRLIDFFREFTVHVDGVGYVCSFAVFDFKRHGNAQYGAPGYPGNAHLVSREGKLEQSVVNFKLNHPEWTPLDPLASVYLQRVQDAFHQQQRSQILKQRDWMVQSGLMAGPPDAETRRRGKQPERDEPGGGDSAGRLQSPGLSEVNSTEASHLLYLSAMANVSHQPNPPTAGVLSLVNQFSARRMVVPVTGSFHNPSQTDTNMLYTDVCVALYDYAAQDDDELTIHEGDVLFLIDGSDADWAKVQLKPSPEMSQPATAADQPGLVPATYIERVESLGQATALYDYQAREPEELTLAEGTLLEVLLDDDLEWTFVRHNGQAGFVPTSYLDQASRSSGDVQAELDQPPTLPKREEPTEARVDSVPAAPTSPLPKSDPRDIAYWSVTEVTKKKKDARKGMLGVGDLQVFYSCTTDKSPVRQWSIEDLESYTVKKDTVQLVFARSTSPSQLQFQLASRTEATAVADKIDLTRRKAAGQLLPDAAPQLPQSPAKSPTHTQITDPVTMVEAQLAVVLYDFSAAEDGELSVTAGQMVYVLDNVSSADWWTCQLATDDVVPAQGLVPATYMQLTDASEAQVEPASTLPQAASSPTTAPRDSAPTDTLSTHPRRSRSSSTGRALGKKDDLPDPQQLRTWVDSSGSFRVEAAFVGLTDDGRIKLHKANGVRIAVPMKKFNRDAIAYIERQTGQMLQPAAKPRRKVNTDFDWFDFFTLKCDINADRALRYATAFTAESLDDSSLDTLTAELLATLGVHEDDRDKVMQGCQRALGKPTKATKQVSFGGASIIDDANEIPTPPARSDSLDRDARLAQQLQSQEVAQVAPKAAAQRRALSAIDERFERQRQIEEDELLARKLQSADRKSRRDPRNRSPRPALVDPFDNLDVLTTPSPALSSPPITVNSFRPLASPASPQPLGLGLGARKSTSKRAPPAKSAPTAIHPQQILQAQKQLSAKPISKAIAPANTPPPPVPAKAPSTVGFTQDDWTRQLPLPSAGTAAASPVATMALVPRAQAIPLATALPNPLVPVPSGSSATMVSAPAFVPTRDPPPRPSTVPTYRPIAAPATQRPPLVQMVPAVGPFAVYPLQPPAPQFAHFQTQPARPVMGMPMSTSLAMNSLVAPVGMSPSVSAPSFAAQQRPPGSSLTMASPRPSLSSMALTPSAATVPQDKYSVFRQAPSYAPGGVFQTSAAPSTSLPSQALVPFGQQQQQRQHQQPTPTYTMVSGMHGVQPTSLGMAPAVHHPGSMPPLLAPLAKVNSAPGYPLTLGATPTNPLNMVIGSLAPQPAPANYTLQPRPVGMMGAQPQQAMAWSMGPSAPASLSMVNPSNMLPVARPPSLVPGFHPTSSSPMNLGNANVFAPVNPPAPPTNRPYGVFSSANWRPSG